MPTRQSRNPAPSRVILSNNPDIRNIDDFLGGPSRHRHRHSSRERSSRARRQHRRITGYHNVFDELSPPDYDVFGAPSSQEAATSPPKYECTVEASDILEVIWERNSPFQPAQMSPWQPVHVSLQGTLFTISNAKTHGLLTPAWKRGRPTGEAGRRIRSYTLQHAEVGLASDHKKVEMVPKSPIAQLLPESALKQLQETDPSQFDIVYNYIARVRLEGDQLLLRFKDSEARSDWVENICAAIDIALPLEVRSEPRNHTLPRRRRRHEGPRVIIRTTASGLGLAPASLVAEQERILREHYPQLMQSARAPTQTQQQQQQPPASPREQEEGGEAQDGENGEDNEEDNDNDNENDNPQEPEPEPDPDYGDLDLAFMRDPTSDNDAEDEERHMNNMSDILTPIGQQRARTSPNGNHSNDSSPPSSPNFNTTNRPTTHLSPSPQPAQAREQSNDGKWHPRVPRNDPERDARYRRRCMPMLVHNSRYAQPFIIHKGKRKVIDWHSKKLIPWPNDPPSYHDVLYGPAKIDPSKAGEEGQEESQRRARENLPPGAGNAVMRLRGLLRRHASSGDLQVGPWTGSEQDQASPQRRPRPRRGPTSSNSSGANVRTAGNGEAALSRNDAITPIDPNAVSQCTSQSQSADSTPSATTVNTNTTGECSSSGDDQSVQSPAISFADPNVKTKASNSSAFSRKLKERFGRRTINDNIMQGKPMLRAETRSGFRDEDTFDEKNQSRLARLRTASSLDIRRPRM